MLYDCTLMEKKMKKRKKKTGGDIYQVVSGKFLFAATWSEKE